MQTERYWFLKQCYKLLVNKVSKGIATTFPVFGSNLALLLTLSGDSGRASKPPT